MMEGMIMQSIEYEAVHEWREKCREEAGFNPVKIETAQIRNL